MGRHSPSLARSYIVTYLSVSRIGLDSRTCSWCIPAHTHTYTPRMGNPPCLQPPPALPRGPPGRGSRGDRLHSLPSPASPVSILESLMLPPRLRNALSTCLSALCRSQLPYVLVVRNLLPPPESSLKKISRQLRYRAARDCEEDSVVATEGREPPARVCQTRLSFHH